MTKTQAPYGSSLAPTYDTVGTKQSPSADLRTDEIILTHEMGQVIFSERLQISHRHLISAATIQATAFNTVISDLPTSHYRIANIQCVIDDASIAADIEVASVLHRDVSNGRENVLWTYHGATGSVARMVIDMGAGVTERELLIPSAADSAIARAYQQLGRGFEEGVTPSSGVRNLAIRGVTGAVFTGSRSITAIITVIHALPGAGQIRSEGLPIPSW